VLPAPIGQNPAIMDESLSSEREEPKPSASKRVSKWLKFFLRWGVAVIGIYWVLSQMSVWDKVLVVRNGGMPVAMTLSEPMAREDQASYRVVGQQQAIPRAETVNKPDRKTVKVDGQAGDVKLLGLDLSGDLNRDPEVQRLLIDAGGGHSKWITPADLAEHAYKVRVPYPRVDVGVSRLVRQASSHNLIFLIAAVLVFPLTFILTAARWHELLKALEINIGLLRAFTLTMVGAFYNTFMPGSTGGDFFKALYVSQATPHRTRAVMSVLIDRVIGLIALIILGGIASATQWQVPQCRHIAEASGVIITGVIVGLTVFYQPTLHRIFGLEWIIHHLPKQKQVQNAVGVMWMYRRRPMLVLAALLVTFPVHMAVICSAMFSGMAFGLPIPASYYWAIVPVIVLSGSIPISPQGAGVMEYFAIRLTETRGVTVSQAFALTMSIRLVQILWNLTGVYFVVRGHFHQPTEREQRELEADLSAVEPA
jgi:uncharacterized protein (TIRG00374 family)